MGKIVAIDYGLKRIGIAISDANRKIALPFQTVLGGKEEIENISSALALQKKEIDLLVIGLPLLMSGKKGEMAERVEIFAEKLSVFLGIPYVFLDERLTSRQAEGSLKELSLNRKKRSRKVDVVAAIFILQTYLEKIAQQQILREGSSS